MPVSQSSERANALASSECRQGSTAPGGRSEPAHTTADVARIGLSACRCFRAAAGESWGVARTVMRMRPPLPYTESLMAELDVIADAFEGILDRSSIENIDPNRGGGGDVMFLGFPTHGWEASDNELEAMRMALLTQVRDWAQRFQLLFPSPTAQVKKRHDDAIALLENWLDRGKKGRHSVPGTVAAAKAELAATVGTLRDARELLPGDDFRQRLVVDTNALMDEPDLAAYVPALGRRYMVHVLPVVLRELDDLKRGGRQEAQREAARKADRRLKGLRDNGDVRNGARVSGDVWVVFEHIEPRGDGLPIWLELGVPDDRFAASTLLLQSEHPGSSIVVATSDLNLQTKLAALSLPFVEPPEANR